MTWLAVGVGGALGSIGRHAVNAVLREHWLFARVPAGTIAVNLAGCLTIGLVAGLVASNRLALPILWREFVFAGLLGGFTTFSAFGLDTFLLARTHSIGHSVANVAVHVIGGLVAVWAGYRLGH